MGWSSLGRAADDTRHPCAGAGRWFPADPATLRETVARYLKDAKADAPPGTVAAVIVPHAGYTYCGPIAGEAFRALQRRDDVRRVILLAFSHSVAVRGISVLNVEAYETPLGPIAVDRPVVETLLKNPLFTSVPRAHATEHSDENQLPFLQVAFGPDVKIVSLFVGRVNDDDFDRAAEAIRPFLDGHTVLVASSDFTHYGEPYGFDPFHGKDVKNRMRELDRGAIDRIAALDFQGFRDYVGDTGATICGLQPISLLLKVLPAAAKGRLLRYQTSADIGGGDYSMAVGYAAIAFHEEKPTSATMKNATAAASTPSTTTAAAKPSLPFEGPATELQNLDLLIPDERRTLLRLARRTLEKAFETSPTRPRLDEGVEPEHLGDFTLTNALRKKSGGFVTLTVGGDLRGCIGYIVGREPLYRTVMNNAVNAAFHDPRFSPVAKGELKKMHIEISVLSPLEATRAEDVVVGRDGLVISGQGRSGVLLPQVPVEQKWTRTEFLDYVCRKAGLPKTAWRDGSATLQRFGAQVFGEE